MRIEPWGKDDLPLLEALLGDPAMMEHLGGPESPVKIRERQARYEPADSGMFKIVLAGGEAVGSVGYWPRSWRGDEINEIGWSVLPAFQRRGIARMADRPDDRAGAGRRRTGASSTPSRRSRTRRRTRSAAALGFTLLGPAEVEYPPGSVLLVNDWRLDLSR